MPARHFLAGLTVLTFLSGPASAQEKPLEHWSLSVFQPLIYHSTFPDRRAGHFTLWSSDACQAMAMTAVAQLSGALQTSGLAAQVGASCTRDNKRIRFEPLVPDGETPDLSKKRDGWVLQLDFRPIPGTMMVPDRKTCHSLAIALSEDARAADQNLRRALCYDMKDNRLFQIEDEEMVEYPMPPL